MKKLPEYIILTPIAPHKLYSLSRFIKNIMSFRPKPKEVVFCAEPEIVPKISQWNQKLKKEKIKLVIFTLNPEELAKYSSNYDVVPKISCGREHLRNYFIGSQFDWALWLDSDIIPKSNIAKTLLEIALLEKSLTVTNKYPGRGEHSWSGIACTLTHKTACILSNFQVASFIWKGKEIGGFSEDFRFLSLLSVGDGYAKMKIGWNSRKINNFVSVWHEVSPGVDKFLKGEISPRRKKQKK